MPNSSKSVRKQGLFEQLYRLDTSTGSYIIEIALDQYSDIFSEWDPAPFKLRDMDPDLEVYLEGCSDDIPMRYPVTLSFTIPRGMRNPPIEEQARNGLRNSFMIKRYFLGKEMERAGSRTLIYLLIGFAFLWGAVIFPARLTRAVFPAIMVEGLFIGGWVFLWEAISLILFTYRDLHYRSRTYRRLQQSPIVFREAEQEG